MKLLIVTQAVDQDNLALGFFHEWIASLASSFEAVTVICLYEGRHLLPENVRVYSLGKNQSPTNRFHYALRFFMLAWNLRKQYDAAFVHMNQEYLLIAGWWWRMLGKRVYLWRNHYAGSFLTDIAAAWCTKVLCTSRFSYTAKYRKTLFMPVGVDLSRFTPDLQTARRENSILFLARMAPSKRPDLLLDALHILNQQGKPFTATFIGSPPREHEAYYCSLVARAGDYGLTEHVRFLPGVANDQTPEIYRTHQIFVNCSPSGMFDKTLFEAAATGCTVLAASEDYARLAGTEYGFSTVDELVDRLAARLETHGSAEEQERMRNLAEEQSLARLMHELTAVLCGETL